MFNIKLIMIIVYFLYVIDMFLIYMYKAINDKNYIVFKKFYFN